MKHIEPSATVSKSAKIGERTKIWHQAQVREGVKIGKDCIVGKGVYVDENVVIGDRVRIQNYASLYHDCTIEDDVFIGPYVCLTNDLRPRSSTIDRKPKEKKDWHAGKTVVKKGASLGAGVIVLPDITIGEYAMVGAGSVVTKNVSSHTLVFGVPVKFEAFICKCGNVLNRVKRPKNLICVSCRKR